VLAALRAELGVDRCVVLPAISFHVDLDVCVRATATGLVACLLDTSRAARIVLSCGLDALHRAGHLSAADHGAARTDLDAGRRGELLERIGPLLQAHQHGPGRYGESFARVFSVAPEDSGVGNIQRLLLAIDVWTAEQLGDASAEEVRIDADSWAYLDSIRRRERDRIQVATALAGLGWRIAAVPGLSDGSRSLNPLNGIHLPGRYLMPAYGGLFAPLDAAGAEALREAFGDAVRIEPVPCAETQRRAGGLHCAVSVEPAR